MRRTRGGYLHPKYRNRAGLMGLSDRMEGTQFTLRTEIEELWSDIPIMASVDCFQYRNEFDRADDVKSAAWLKDNRNTAGDEVEFAISIESLSAAGPIATKAGAQCGSSLGDYIAYQHRYANYFRIDSAGDIGKRTDDIWFEAAVNTDINSSNSVTYDFFIGLIPQLNAPGSGQPFSYEDGLGFHILDRSISFSAKNAGADSLDWSVPDDRLADTIHSEGDWILLGFRYESGEETIHVFIDRAWIMSFTPVGGISFLQRRTALYLTVGIMTRNSVAARFDLKFVKFFVPKEYK